MKSIIVLACLLLSSNCLWYGILCNKNGKIKDLKNQIELISKDREKIKNDFITHSKEFDNKVLENNKFIAKLNKVNISSQRLYNNELQDINNKLKIANAQNIQCENGVKNFGNAFNETLSLKEKKDIENKEEADNS